MQRFGIVNFFDHFWFLLPIISAMLVILSFFPFHIYILSFVAFVPLFYFVHFLPSITPRRAFWGGFVFNTLLSTLVLFFTLAQFDWISGTYLFVWLARTFFFLAALFSGVIGGLLTALYVAKIRTSSLLLNVFLFAILWVLTEWVMSILFFGLRFEIVAYTVASIPRLLWFASVGGPHLISFIVVLVNGFLASVLYCVLQMRVNILFRLFLKKIGIAAVITAIFFVVILLANERYLSDTPNETVEASFAVIQIQDRETNAFGTFAGSGFLFPNLENLLKTANEYEPDFIVYPFSSFRGVLSASTSPGVTFDREVFSGNMDAFGKWEARHVNPESVFIAWNTVYRDGKFYNEFDFWKNGQLVAYHDKRNLFPFLDYTPQGAQRLGLFTTPFDITPAEDRRQTEIGEVRFSNLVCSEVFESPLSRGDYHTNFSLSIGTAAAIFGNGVVGEVNLISAQFRAAENNRPIVRSDRLGPSAMIDSSGKILSKLDYKEKGVLFQNMNFDINPARTLYSIIGDAPLLLGSVLVLGFAFIQNRRRVDAPGT